MPCATRGNLTRPDVYGILSGECRCLCAARLTVATVVRESPGRPSRERVDPGKADTAPKAAPGFRAGLACSSPSAACAGAVIAPGDHCGGVGCRPVGGSAPGHRGGRRPGLPRRPARIGTRRSMDVFWIQRNASGSVRPAVHLQAALGPVQQLAHLQALPQGAHLGPERGQLLEPADRDLDRGHQVGLGERLHQIGHGARVPGPLDEFTLRERGQDDHRGDVLGGDLLGRGDPVQDRHLDVQDQQVGPQLLGQFDRLLPVGRLPGDLVTFLLQHLLQVKPDQRLVFGDHNTDGCLAHSHERTQSGRLASAAPLPSREDSGQAPVDQ